MRRRDFITLLGGAAAWPLAARAQQQERMRRIGALMQIAADDPQAQPRLAAFRQGLQDLGWSDGRNTRLDIRWTAGKPADARRLAAELVKLEPDILLASGSANLEPLAELTRTIPIVFVLVPDPVGSGFVASLAQPGGNVTGFLMFEFSLAAKWLELLTEVAPGVKRAAILRDASLASGIGQFAVIQSVAPSLNLRDAGEIDHGIAEFARSANAGLILTTSPYSAVHRDLIIGLAAQYKLPAVYAERLFAASGGLISYGPNFIDQYRQAASYIDRILKGAKPADLPVQAPTKYELVINLNTAKALGLDVPPTLLARADEVIE